MSKIRINVYRERNDEFGSRLMWAAKRLHKRAKLKFKTIEEVWDTKYLCNKFLYDNLWNSLMFVSQWNLCAIKIHNYHSKNKKKMRSHAIQTSRAHNSQNNSWMNPKYRFRLCLFWWLIYNAARDFVSDLFAVAH